MAVDYVVKWVPADGSSPLTFSGLYEIEGFDADELRWNIPTAESSDDGVFAQDGSADSRTVSFGGLLNGLESSPTDPSALRSLQDTLALSICGGKLGKLYRNSDRYINCRCTAFSRDDDKSYTHLNWNATFLAADPFYYSDTFSGPQSVAISGTTALTIGGTAPVKPLISIAVSGIGTGGTITVTHTTTTISELFTLTPTSTGTYVIDCAAGTVYRGIADSIAQFSGTFFEQVLPSGSSLLITTANGATISSVTATWRQRFYTA